MNVLNHMRMHHDICLSKLARATDQHVKYLPIIQPGGPQFSEQWFRDYMKMDGVKDILRIKEVWEQEVRKPENLV